jgi:hypothetical protein
MELFKLTKERMDEDDVHEDGYGLEIDPDSKSRRAFDKN